MATKPKPGAKPKAPVKAPVKETAKAAVQEAKAEKVKAPDKSKPSESQAAFTGGGFAAFDRMNKEAKARQDDFEKGLIRELMLKDGESIEIIFLHIEPWPIYFHTIARWNDKKNKTDFISKTCPRRFEESTDRCAFCEDDGDTKRRRRSATFLVLARIKDHAEKDAATGRWKYWRDYLDSEVGGGQVMLLRPTKNASVTLMNMLPKKGIDRVYTLTRNGSSKDDTVYTFMNDDPFEEWLEADWKAIQDFAQSKWEKDEPTEELCLRFLSETLAPQDYADQVKFLGRAPASGHDGADDALPPPSGNLPGPPPGHEDVPFGTPPEAESNLRSEAAPRRPVRTGRW